MLFLLLPLINFHINSTEVTNSVTSTINLPLNTSVSGSVDAALSSYYNVTITTSGKYLFNLTATSPDKLRLYIHTPDGTLIGNVSTYNYPEQVSLTISPGTYTVEVSNFGDLTTFLVGAYNYVFTPGEDLAHAINLPLNSIATGSSPYNSYYNFSIVTSGYYKFNLSADISTYFFYYVYDSSGTSIGHPINLNYPEPLALNLTSGNYYVEIFFSSGSGSFNLSVVNYTIHSGEDLAHAVPIPLNQSLTGSMPITSFYNVSVLKNGPYKFNLTSISSNYFYISVYYSNGTKIDQTNDNSYPVDLPLNLTIGQYYIQIWSYSGSGSFDLGFYVYFPHPGEDLAHAIPLIPDTLTFGSLPTARYYNFTVLNSGYYIFNMTANGPNSLIYNPNQVYFSLYSGNGHLIGSSNTTLEVILSIERVFVIVSSATNSGLFNLTVHKLLPGENLHTAINLPLKTPTFGNLKNFNYYYNFTITILGDYTVFLGVDDPTNNIGINLYDSTGKLLSWSLNPPKHANSYLNIGNYSVQVLSDPYYTGSTMSFNLTLEQGTPESILSSSLYSSSTVVSGKDSNSASNSIITKKITPFSSIYMIIFSLLALAVVNFSRRRKH